MIPLIALGQSEDRSIDVVEVSGVIDGLIADFVESTLEEANAGSTEVVVIQLDSQGSAGITTDRFASLVESIDTSEVPVVVWVGPEPAQIRGDAHRILAAADFAFASNDARFAGPDGAITTVRVDSIPEGVSEVIPTLQQVIQIVDGETAPNGSEIATLRATSDGDTTTLPIVFRGPGYWAQFWRLAATPHAAFFFLVVGLTVATFEFYAVGPGVAAATGAISIALGAYGLAVLPIRWWALVVVLLGWAVLTMSHQRGGVLALTAAGAILMAAGGMTLNGGGPAITTNWWLMVASVLAVLFFYLLAMPVVGRSRFSTPTLGAEGMIGKEGVAVGEFEPDGEIEIEGATWRAGAHREAGISDGEPIRVVAVDGVFLDVERVNGSE